MKFTFTGSYELHFEAGLKDVSNRRCTYALAIRDSLEPRPSTRGRPGFEASLRLVPV